MLVFTLVTDTCMGYLLYLGSAFLWVVSPALSFFFVTGCTDKSYLLRKHLFHCRNCIRHLCVLCISLCPAHKIDSEMVGLSTKNGELAFVAIWKQLEGPPLKHLLQWGRSYCIKPRVGSGIVVKWLWPVQTELVSIWGIALTWKEHGYSVLIQCLGGSSLFAFFPCKHRALTRLFPSSAVHCIPNGLH